MPYIVMDAQADPEDISTLVGTFDTEEAAKKAALGHSVAQYGDEGYDVAVTPDTPLPGMFEIMTSDDPTPSTLHWSNQMEGVDSLGEERDSLVLVASSKEALKAYLEEYDMTIPAWLEAL